MNASFSGAPLPAQAPSLAAGAPAYTPPLTLPGSNAQGVSQTAAPGSVLPAASAVGGSVRAASWPVSPSTAALLSQTSAQKSETTWDAAGVPATTVHRPWSAVAAVAPARAGSAAPSTAASGPSAGGFAMSNTSTMLPTPMTVSLATALSEQPTPVASQAAQALSAVSNPSAETTQAEAADPFAPPSNESADLSNRIDEALASALESQPIPSPSQSTAADPVANAEDAPSREETSPLPKASNGTAGQSLKLRRGGSSLAETTPALKVEAETQKPSEIAVEPKTAAAESLSSVELMSEPSKSEESAAKPHTRASHQLEIVREGTEGDDVRDAGEEVAEDDGADAEKTLEDENQQELGEASSPWKAKGQSQQDKLHGEKAAEEEASAVYGTEEGELTDASAENSLTDQQQTSVVWRENREDSKPVKRKIHAAPRKTKQLGKFPKSKQPL